MSHLNSLDWNSNPLSRSGKGSIIFDSKVNRRELQSGQWKGQASMSQHSAFLSQHQSLLFPRTPSQLLPSHSIYELNGNDMNCATGFPQQHQERSAPIYLHRPQPSYMPLSQSVLNFSVPYYGAHTGGFAFGGQCNLSAFTNTRWPTFRLASSAIIDGHFPLGSDTNMVNLSPQSKEAEAAVQLRVFSTDHGIPKSKRRKTTEQKQEREILKTKMNSDPTLELYCLFVQDTLEYKNQLDGKPYACVDVLSSRKRSCQCIQFLVKGHACPSDSLQDGTMYKLMLMYSALTKSNLKLGKDTGAEGANRNIRKCFSLLSRFIRQVVHDGSGKNVFFEFNQLRPNGVQFCGKALQNLMGFEEERWFSTCLKSFKQNEMFENCVLGGLCKVYCESPGLLEGAEISNEASEKMYGAFKAVAGDRVPPTPFFRKSRMVYAFISRDDVGMVYSDGQQAGKAIFELPGTPAYIEYDPSCSVGEGITDGVLDQFPSRNPRKDDNDKRQLPNILSELLIHEDDARVFRVPQTIAKQLDYLREELLVKGFSRNIDTVMGLRPLKYRSTMHAEKGWISFFTEIMKAKNRSKDLKVAEDLHSWFQDLVKIMVGPGFYVRYDVGFMRTELATKATKDLAQTLHFDTPRRSILELYSRNQKMFVGFMPIEPEGMWLMICKCYDGRPDQTEMKHIPQGEILFVPITLLHAGGFRTSYTGNLRLHFYVYCSLDSKDIIGNYSLGNDYVTFEKSNSGKSSTYKKTQSAWNQGAVKFFHDHFQNGRDT